MYTGYGGGTPLSIDENAKKLKAYIARVKGITGAKQVDIVAHSMGGLIARRYIAKYMDPPDVHQLIMLGTPNLGSVTAVINQLAWYLGQRLNPSSAELTPWSVIQFNSDNPDHRGVPLYAIAGNYSCLTKFPQFNPIEPDPDDIAVSAISALGIPLNGGWTFPGLVPGCEGHHLGMRRNASSDGGLEIFNRYVKPLLQGRTPEQSDIQASTIDNATLQAIDSLNKIQFTEVQTGTLQPGGQLEFSYPPEPTERVHFIVVGPSEQISVSLRDPNGQLITADTSDPSIQYIQMDKDILPFTSYTISNPVAGIWTTIVAATDQVPTGGTRIAVLRSLTSDIRLSLLVLSDTPQVNHPVTILAQLQSNNTEITGASVSGQLFNSTAAATTIMLFDDGQHNDNAADDGIYGYQFMPVSPSVYSALISADGVNGDLPFHRHAVWAIQVEGNQIFLPTVSR